MKALKAPKLMNEVEVATSRNIATRPTMPVEHYPDHRGAELGAEPAEDRRGRTPSRPIAYSSRDALAWLARPEANCATTRPARKIEANSLPPIMRAIERRGGRVLEYAAGVDQLGHVGGDEESAPPIRAMSSMARGCCAAGRRSPR